MMGSVVRPIPEDQGGFRCAVGVPGGGTYSTFQR